MKDFTDGPAPGFFRLWWRKGAAFALILAVATGISTFGSYQSLKLGLAFDARGVEGIATATDRRKQTVRRNDSSETDYYVTFDYDAQGTVVSVERKVSRSLYRALTPGATRAIRYLPENPRRMEHTIGATWEDGQVMRWLALVFGLACLGAFWWTARPAIEAIRARKYGRAEWAKVLYVDERKQRTKNGTSTSYVMVWRDKRGVQGESLPSGSNTRYVRYGPTSDIEVYRDSRGKTWWVGDVGPRASTPTVPSVGKS